MLDCTRRLEIRATFQTCSTHDVIGGFVRFVGRFVVCSHGVFVTQSYNESDVIGLFVLFRI